MKVSRSPFISAQQQQRLTFLRKRGATLGHPHGNNDTCTSTSHIFAHARHTATAAASLPKARSDRRLGRAHSACWCRRWWPRQTGTVSAAPLRPAPTHLPQMGHRVTGCARLSARFLPNRRFHFGGEDSTMASVRAVNASRCPAARCLSSCVRVHR